MYESLLLKMPSTSSIWAHSTNGKLNRMFKGEQRTEWCVHAQSKIKSTVIDI